MLLERLRRAALLDSAVYREVAADTTAMTQATALVIVLALIYQTGILIQSLLAGGAAAETLGTFLLGIVGGIIIWIALAYVAHFLGTKLFGGRGTAGGVLRATAFALTPEVFGLVILVPVVGKFLYFGVNLWAILATILAIRDALQVSTRRALGISLASLVVLTTLGMGLAAGAMAAGWQPFAP